MKKAQKKNLHQTFSGILFFLSSCWKINKKYIIWLFINQFLNIANTLSIIIFPQHIIDAAFGVDEFNTTFLYIICFVWMVLVISALLNLAQRKITNNKMMIYKEFQLQISRTMMEVPYQKIESSSFLDLKAKAEQFLYGGGNGFATVLEAAFNILGEIITLITIASIISQLNTVLVFFLIILVLINTISNYYTQKKNIGIRMKQAEQERRSLYYSNISQDYRYGKEIRGYNLKKWILKKYSDQLDVMQKFYYNISFNNMKNGFIVTLTATIQQMFSYMFVAYKAFNGEITVGQFSMFISSITTFASTLKNIASNLISMQQYSIYYDAYKEYMNNEKDNNTKAVTIEEVNYIEFKSVSFKYPNQNEYVLKNVSVKIKAREKIMIVGENGSGKSTFIKLLLRIYKPQLGKIFINGIDINTVDFESYSKLFATVFQDFALFSFKISENIALSDDIDSGMITKIFNNVNLTNKVNSLPYKEDTFIYRDFDDEGYIPSGGEKQKIAMSRAVYRTAPIVIMDEPTAALDPVAEHNLYKLFDEMFFGKTCIYISHRLSSVKLCNRVLVFAEGHLVEDGTHDDLIEKKGYYERLYSLQAQYYINK